MSRVRVALLSLAIAGSVMTPAPAVAASVAGAPCVGGPVTSAAMVWTNSKGDRYVRGKAAYTCSTNTYYMWIKTSLRQYYSGAWHIVATRTNDLYNTSSVSARAAAFCDPPYTPWQFRTRSRARIQQTHGGPISTVSFAGPTATRNC